MADPELDGQNGSQSSRFSVQHSEECPYAGLGTCGYLAMNAGMGALRASDLSLGLLPLFPNLPDLPSTFLDNQKFHSLWCLLSKTPRAEKSPLIPMFGGCGMPCLVLVGSSRPCGSVCSASTTHARDPYPRLPCLPLTWEMWLRRLPGSIIARPLGIPLTLRMAVIDVGICARGWRSGLGMPPLCIWVLELLPPAPPHVILYIPSI